MKANILPDGTMRFIAESDVESYALARWSESEEKKFEYMLEVIDLGYINKMAKDFYEQNKKEFIEWRKEKIKAKQNDPS